MNSQRIRRILVAAALWLAVPGAVEAARLPTWADDSIRDSCSSCYEGEDAVVLLDEWQVELNEGERTGIRRYIVKLLSEKGRGLATVVLPSSEFRSYKKVRVWVHSPNGDCTKFDEDDGTLLGASEVNQFEDVRVLAVEPPGLVPGSTVALEYQFRHAADLAQDLFPVQRAVPVERSVVRARVGRGWRVHATVSNGENPGPVETVDAAVWEFQDIPGKRTTQLYLAPVPVRTQLALTYVASDAAVPFRDWSSTASWIGRFFELDAEDLNVHAEWGSAAGNASEDLVDAAGRDARSLRYFAIALGWEGFIPRSPQTTLRRAFGDCKDKSQVMIAQLRRNGVEAFPVLAMAASDGHVAEDLPSPFVFNHVVTGIPWSGPRRPGMAILDHPKLGAIRLYDATLPNAVPQDISVALEGGFGLLLHPDAAGLIRFPGGTENDNHFELERRMTIDLDGIVRTSSRGRAHGALRAMLQGEAGAPLDAKSMREDAYESIATVIPRFDELSVSEVRIDADGAWSYELSFISDSSLVEFEGIRALEFGALVPEDSIPVPENDTDEAKVYVPFSASFRHSFEIVLSKGWRLVAGPQPVDVNSSLGQVSMSFDVDGSTIKLKRSFTMYSKELSGADLDEILKLKMALQRANTSTLLFEPVSAALALDGPVARFIDEGPGQ